MQDHLVWLERRASGEEVDNLDKPDNVDPRVPEVKEVNEGQLENQV